MLLSSHLPALRQLRIVLASQSPRRREILEKCAFPFEQLAPTFAEDLDKASFASPADYVVENARRKAMEIALMDGSDEAAETAVEGAAGTASAATPEPGECCSCDAPRLVATGEIDQCARYHPAIYGSTC